MIDTQAIRKKILDLALRGKLTEQLPEDGTAEELFQRIQQEKSIQKKTGKRKKGEPDASSEQEDIPFELPLSWMWVEIGEIFTLHAGKNITADRIADKQSDLYSYPCYGGTGLRGYVEQYNTSGIHALIGRQGALCGNINFAEGDFYATEHAVVVEVYAETDTIWAGLFLRALNLNQYATSVAQPGLAVNKIEKVLIPLPPISEQKRIVEKIESSYSVLDTIDTLQNQYQDNLATLKSKIIDAGIQGKLTEQLPENGNAEELYQQIHTNQGIEKKDIADINADLPEIPFTWCWVHLGDIVRVLGGKRIPAGRKLTTEDTGHKYIRISDMKNRSVDAEKLLFVPEDIYPSIAQYIIHKEDVYITVAGTIGRVGKIPESVDGANLTENADRLVFSNLDQDWLIYCLTSTFVQKQIEYLTTQVAQPKLAIKRIQEFLLPLPPFAEQKRIVAKLEELLPLCEG